MSDNHPAWRKLAFGLSASAAILCRSVLAAGGIATDGSFGPARTLSGVAVEIPQSLGRTVGANLFHSFSTFNVEAGQTVTFTGDGQLQNVVSRVTGGETSRIDGLLRSQIGQADFYLINPAGAVFGPNAQIDVPAAFHVGTADRLKFADGAVFAAASGLIGQLSGTAPAAFGFLERSSGNNGLVEIDGAQLAARGGQTIDIAARGIHIENRASLTAAGGEIRLISIAGEGEAGLIRSGGVLPFATVAPNLAGPIALRDSVVNVSGNGGGRISLSGSDIVVGFSEIDADNTGNLDASTHHGIEISSHALTLEHASISSQVASTGRAGSIAIASEDDIDLIKGARITSDTSGGGAPGAVNVYSGGDLNIIGADAVPSQISSQADGFGQNGGDILVKVSGKVNISGFFSGMFANVYPGAGDAGKLTIEAGGDVNISDGAKISSVSVLLAGNGGAIQVNAGGGLLIDGKASATDTGIFSSAHFTQGHGGDINVEVDGDINLVGGGKISSDTLSAGNSGSISIVTSGNLTVGQDNAEYSAGTSISSTAYPLIDLSTQSIIGESPGIAGDIHVKSLGSVNILNGGRIFSNTFYSAGAGNIDIAAGGGMRIDGGAPAIEGIDPNDITGIFSDNRGGSGPAGNVAIQVRGELDILRNGRISSDTLGSGDAGPVTVFTGGRLLIDGTGQSAKSFRTGISSTTQGNASGDAGHVEIDSAASLVIVGGGFISTTTSSFGDAGEVHVKADSLTIDGRRNGIFQTGIFSKSISGNTGDVGSLEIVANRSISIANDGQISIENASEKVESSASLPAFITISSRDIGLDHARLTTVASGTADAGAIKLSFDTLNCRNRSFITTEANEGDGGAIDIIGSGLVSLRNSGIKTTAHGATSDGGDIRLAGDTLILETGLIQANANGGYGGNIRIDAKALIPSGDTLLLGGAQAIEDWRPGIFGYNIVQAASKAHASGVISSTAPQLNLSGILANLGASFMDVSSLSQGYCAAGTGSSLSYGGRGGILRKYDDSQVF